MIEAHVSEHGLYVRTFIFPQASLQEVADKVKTYVDLEHSSSVEAHGEMNLRVRKHKSVELPSFG